MRYEEVGVERLMLGSPDHDRVRRDLRHRQTSGAGQGMSDADGDPETVIGDDRRRETRRRRHTASQHQIHRTVEEFVAERCRKELPRGHRTVAMAIEAGADDVVDLAAGQCG